MLYAIAMGQIITGKSWPIWCCCWCCWWWWWRCQCYVQVRHWSVATLYSLLHILAYHSIQVLEASVRFTFNIIVGGVAQW